MWVKVFLHPYQLQWLGGMFSARGYPFYQSVMCDPDYAIFVPYEIEYGYEIRLDEGFYIFEVVGDTIISKTIVNDIYIDLITINDL